MVKYLAVYYVVKYTLRSPHARLTIIILLFAGTSTACCSAHINNNMTPAMTSESYARAWCRGRCIRVFVALVIVTMQGHVLTQAQTETQPGRQPIKYVTFMKGGAFDSRDAHPFNGQVFVSCCLCVSMHCTYFVHGNNGLRGSATAGAVFANIANK